MGRRRKESFDIASGRYTASSFGATTAALESRRNMQRETIAKSAEKKYDASQPRVLGLGGSTGAFAGSSSFGPGWQEIVAPTTSPGRPRALRCGYGPSTDTLVIVMRNDGPGGQDIEAWIQYDDIDKNTWRALTMANSTHTFVTTFLAGQSWTKIDPGDQPTQDLDDIGDPVNDYS